MPPRDKYVPLGTYLRPLAAEHSDVTLTFAEIERIIRARLPLGARHAAFWQGVKGKPPPRARAWMAAGFVAQPDLGRARVRFHRQAPPVKTAPQAPARQAAPHPGARHGDRR